MGESGSVVKNGCNQVCQKWVGIRDYGVKMSGRGSAVGNIGNNGRGQFCG